MQDFSKEPVIKRFLKYVSYPTMSADDAGKVPSTEKQFALAKALADELTDMGLSNVRLTDHCYVYATLPGTVSPELDSPKIGLIAHMDTSPDASDENIHPSICCYTGSDILLNEEKNIYLSEKQFPILSIYKGKHLIVTDGTTLLGGDDKCGVAEIITAVEAVMNSNKPHRTVQIAFTPDEEVGHGPDFFDVEGFGADFAYTLDGLRLGELEYENFNAASASILFHGVNVHPGSAKNQMKNALLYAIEFASSLPAEETPAMTEGYEGFYHLNHMAGTVEQAQLNYIIRDHDKTKFESKKKNIESLVTKMKEKYGDSSVELKMNDSYYNMKDIIEKHPEIPAKANKAMKENGVEPIVQPIRGCTDGARLSFVGLPCPNLGTGDNNAHSRFEFVCCDDMVKMVDIVYSLLMD